MRIETEEFLRTYGWAILCSLIMIGILYYLIEINQSHLNENCLKEKAENYCKSINLTFFNTNAFDTGFSCNLPFNPRLEQLEPKTSFLFLSDEIKNCTEV